MTKIMYMVMCLVDSRDIALGESTAKLEMSWADGMVGVMPIFDDEESAYQYAGEKYEVLAIERSM
jgi:hypothetical protein